MDFLPEGKLGIVCFSIDDVHPQKAEDGTDFGGGLSCGPLGHIEWLHERHPQIKVTLAVTANWIEKSPFPTKKFLGKVPYVREKIALAETFKKDTFSLTKHADFVNYLNSKEYFEVALHGLYHFSKGLRIPVEFQKQSQAETDEIIAEVLRIFDESGIEYTKAFFPPGWNAPKELLKSLVKNNINIIASTRDLATPISRTAKTNGSGFRGVSLICPTTMEDGALLHITANFSPTTPIDRAFAVIENGGILHIKAHIAKTAVGYVALDGVDVSYRNYLDAVFTLLEDRYGDGLLWLSLKEIRDLVDPKE